MEQNSNLNSLFQKFTTLLDNESDYNIIENALQDIHFELIKKIHLRFLIEKMKLLKITPYSVKLVFTLLRGLQIKIKFIFRHRY